MTTGNTNGDFSFERSINQCPSEDMIEAFRTEELGKSQAQRLCIPQIQDQFPEDWINLTVNWAGKSFSLDVAESDRVYDLKVALYSMTNVPLDRQKIIGLVRGKLPPDEDTIGSLKLVNGKKFTLVGTPEGDELKDPSKMEYLPDILNDLDIDFSANPSAAVAYQNDVRNLRKIKEAAANLQINFMNPTRENKKLLVLDLDYTIVDTKPLLSGALPPIECARPRLHEFLEAVYPFYDICIWSQTSWVWLETKLVELGMIGSDRNYKISFVLDKTSMFTVFSTREGQRFSHSVKALKIIWNHLPKFGIRSNASNTVHVDDLGRNFALNPSQGLKIRAFKESHTLSAGEDRELDKLAMYLLHIAPFENLTSVNHKDWKKVVRNLLTNNNNVS